MVTAIWYYMNQKNFTLNFIISTFFLSIPQNIQYSYIYLHYDTVISISHILYTQHTIIIDIICIMYKINKHSRLTKHL